MERAILPLSYYMTSLCLLISPVICLEIVTGQLEGRLLHDGKLRSSSEYFLISHNTHIISSECSHYLLIMLVLPPYNVQCSFYLFRMRSKDITTLAEEVLPSIEGVRTSLELLSSLSTYPRYIVDFKTKHRNHFLIFEKDL